MLRFFACERDLSHEPLDAPLPDTVASGAENFFVVGRFQKVGWLEPVPCVVGFGP